MPDAQGVPTREEIAALLGRPSTGAPDSASTAPGKRQKPALQPSAAPVAAPAPPSGPRTVFKPVPASKAPVAAQEATSPGEASRALQSGSQAAVQRFRKLYEQFGPWTAKRKPGFRAMPENFVKGVLGMGPALTGAASLVPRLAAAMVKASPLNPNLASRTEAQVQAGAAGAAGVQALAHEAAEAVKRPLETVQKYPFEILPVASGAAKLAAKGTVKAVSALEATEPMFPGITKPLAERLAPLAAAAKPVAERGPVRAGATAADEALRRHVPAYGLFREHQDAVRATEQVVMRAEQQELLARNRDYRQFWTDYGTLTDDQHEQFISYMSGLRAVDEPLDHEVFRAIEGWKRLPAQVQNEWIRLGKLSPEAARFRAAQPLRIEEFAHAVGREGRKLESEAAAARAATEQQLNDFVASVAEHGGDRGPIDGGRMRSVARYLTGMFDPKSSDPVALAKEIFEREAPRLAMRGQFPKRFVGDWEGALRQAKKGVYTNATAPLLHQIEGIVKGLYTGRAAPPPAGLLGAPTEGAAIAAEARRFLGSKRAPKVLRKAVDAHARQNLIQWFEQEAAAKGLAGEDAYAYLENQLALYEHGGRAITPEMVERFAADNQAFRRSLGGAVERPLQRLRERQMQVAMPAIEDVIARRGGSRRGWEMMRAEWDALPRAERARRFRGFGPLPEDIPEEQWYEHLVERAINRRRPVPREVLEQNPEWHRAALTPANRRLLDVTDELAATVAEQGREFPMYFPLIREPVVFQWRNLFSAFGKGQRFKPKSLRQSFGQTYAEHEFVKDPRILAARATDDLRKYKKAEQIIHGVLKDARIPKREIKSAADLLPGEVAWSPDGLKLWRRQVEFGEKFLGEMQRFGVSEEGAARALGESIRASIGEGAWTAREAGFGAGKVYAIPEGVGKTIASAYQEAPPWIRNLVDPLTGAWRWGVLSARPAWVWNNMVGNVTFSTLNGVAPRHYIMALQEQFIAKTPDELNGISLTAQEADLGVINAGAKGGPLGAFAEWLNSKPTAPVNLGEALTGARGAARVAGRLLDPRRAPAWIREKNGQVEDFFRRANFIKEVERTARAAAVKRATTSFGESYSLLDAMDALTEKQVAEVVKKVNYFMHNYAELTPWEKAYVRRIVPFYNFLKHQFRLTTQLPVDYPGRATMLQALVQVGKEAQAYDNSRLPDYLRNKGLVDTGYTLEVDQPDGTTRPLRAFVSTSGVNPFIVGYSPAGGSEEILGFDLPGAAGLTYTQASPLWKYLALGVRRGYDPQTGRALGSPQVVEMNGRFYAVDPKTGGPMIDRERGGFVEASPPMPGPVEYGLGQVPAVQVARRMVEPRAGWTGDPLSMTPSRQFANRVRALELLRYFTPVNIVLVDQRDLRRPVLSQRETYELLYRFARHRRAMAPPAKKPTPPRTEAQP